MIKKENKLIQITLDPEHLELLNSLASRFHCSKTDLIKQAIKVFAGSKKHRLTTYYTAKSINKNITQEEWDELFKDDKEPNNKIDDSDIPF